MTEQEKTPKYRIAEFAKMVGIEPSTVRYYEKQGLIGKARDENGYRKFDKYDAFRMNHFRSIYARGFSIKETIELMENPERARFIEGLRKNSEDMERELRLLEVRKHWAEETVFLLERLERGEPMLWHTTVPDFYYLPASIDGDFSVTQENGGVRGFWEEYLGYTRFVAAGDAAAYLAGENVFDLGEAVSAEHFARLGYPTDGTVKRLEMGECLCFAAELRAVCDDTIKDYLREHDLIPTGVLLSFFLMLTEQTQGGFGVMAMPVRSRKK